ncbi:MAG: filamentous hemagglutinin N-terminal domain-containing protein, partial [Comamonas sp.]|uniref:two-partner secretion domain-containing protein n=1 Tax=Comamonas sp. TaxID=34028 RepID=UPI002FC9345A
MNHIYTVLWNAVLGRFCVASELGRKRSTTERAERSGVQPRRPTALAALLAMAWAGPGWATLPQDHALVHGQATVQTANGRMTITQTTPKAILDWQSFNVGMTNRVKFQQPSPSSTVLNRVVGPYSSAIYGRIQSNGRVFLVNPNGVFFGKGASVDVGGLVASTLNVANEDFLAGRCHFSALPNQEKIASVINQGQITVAEGGAVVLLGGYVANGGQIRAQRGLVALASDGRVTLDFGDDGSLQMAVDGAALKAVIHNSGHIEADGGTVWLNATSADKLVQSVIGNTGVIQARTVGEHDGKIYLYADGPGAVVRNWGTLDVSAPQGNGGVISLGGEQVVLFSTTQITAQADAGEHGHFQVTAPRLQVSKEGGIDADVLSATLGRNHVYLNANEGDIQVDAPVAWGQNHLTLDAAQSVHINSTMTASGTSMLNIVHGEAAAGDEQSPSDRGLNMGLSESGFTGRVDFLDVLDQSDPQNRRLYINGENYALLTQTGANGSRTGVDLQGIDGKLDGHYALAADIDAAAAENFKPIGNELEPFSGKFEGLGHQITNLSIDRSSETHAGLFGLSAGSTRNLALNKGSVKGGDNSKVVAGSIVGTLLAQGSVANVHTSASVQAHSDQTHTAIAIAGNVIGRIDGGNLSNAHALGATSAKTFSRGNMTYARAGGAVGHLQRGSVTDTHAAGPVTASAISRSIQYSRDARGAPIFDSSVPPTYAEGTALSYAGGAIGLKGAGKINNITATGPVSDMSIGSTSVSLHALVGNDPGATRGRADKLHAMPAAPVQTLAPAMP